MGDGLGGLWLADPHLGLKPMLAKLREQQPEVGADTKEVRKALTALKAESEATEATSCQHWPRHLCQHWPRAFERGPESRLHRLPQAAVRHGRRPGEAPHLRYVPR